MIQKIASYDAPVLIEGETGTGKELTARAIHYRSARRVRPFVPMNCGALPDALIESELFGHLRGAFTDARDDRLGLVAVADFGTLFLDEVDALTPKAQVTLLRFLQDQQYRPLGGRREERANVRVVAAANRSLDELVDAGGFRIDLLYRLKLMRLVLPPLRDRKGDVEMLARHFLELGAARFGCTARPLARATLDWFERYAWPGNVRELEHAVYQGLLLSDGPEVTIEPPPSLGPASPCLEGPPTYLQAKRKAIASFEQEYLTQLMSRSRGNVSLAARIAGTERRHLGRLLRKHGLSASSPRV